VKFLLSFFWLICLMAVQPVPSPAAAEIPAARSVLSGKVLWVYDGDTLEVAGFGKVRLLGIDAPEQEPSPRDTFFTRQGIAPGTLRRIHAEGRNFLITHLKGVTVSLDSEPEERDRHGRLLAYVTLPDGRLLNQVMLDRGFAVVYRRFDFTLKDDFLQAESLARSGQRGLWQ